MLVSILGKNGPKDVHLNRRKAIRERCLNCSGWFYTDVKNCEFTDCPLHLFRSGQGKQNAKARSKAIRKFCPECMNGKRAEVSKCPSNDCPLFIYRKRIIDRSVNLTAFPKKHQIRTVSREKKETLPITMRKHNS
jgi:hypothetical protein